MIEKLKFISSSDFLFRKRQYQYLKSFLKIKSQKKQKDKDQKLPNNFCSLKIMYPIFYFKIKIPK